MTEEFINKLRNKNIYLDVEDNELIVDAPKGILDDFTIEELKANKRWIIDFINSKNIKKTSVNQIQKAPLKENYPLSSAQKSFWIMSELNENAIFNNQSREVLHKNDFDSKALEYSLHYLIERYEVLRTVFKKDAEGEVKQYILEPHFLKFSIDYKDLNICSDKKAALNTSLKEELFKPFDLSQGPLFRLTVYFYEDLVLISQTIHHIISDRWSMLIFEKELLQVYNSFIKGNLNPLTPLKIQYADYSVWEEKAAKSDYYFSGKAFFDNQFSGTLPILEFPVDKIRPKQRSHKGRKFARMIDTALLNNLKLISKTNGGTLYVGLLTVVNILIHKHTNQTDIIIGFPISGRDNVELEDQLGVFMKTLGLRTQFDKDDNFESLFASVKDIFFETLKYSDFPFDEFINELKHQRDIRKGSVFDLIVVLQNQNVNGEVNLNSKNKEGFLDILTNQDGNVFSIMDLEFYFVEVEDGLVLNLIYNEDVFNHETIIQLSNHFEQILQYVINQPSVPIMDIDYLTEQEKTKLLTEFNKKNKSFSNEHTFIELFKDVVSLYPDKPALIYDNEIFTYKDIDQNSTKITKIIKNLN